MVRAPAEGRRQLARTRFSHRLG